MSERDDPSHHARCLEAMGKAESERYFAALHSSEAAAADLLFVIKVGIALRSTGHSARADEVLASCLETPARFAALFELGVSKAHQGDVDGSVAFLETRMRETGMMPIERIFLALQYARQARLDRAQDELAEIVTLQPDLTRECLTSWQSYRFMDRFNRRRTLGLLEEVKSKFAFYTSPQDVAERIAEALRQKQPFLLLRMGDGEGASLRLSTGDHADFNLLYESNLAEFTEIWFGDRAVAGDPAFQAVLRDFNRAIREADLLGCIHAAGIEQEFRLGSRRGIVWAANILRFLLSTVSARATGSDDDAKPRFVLGDPNIHYSLYSSGCLERLVRSQSRIGLVSCQSELRDAFVNNLGLEVDFLKIPGEKIHRNVLGDAAVEGTHWPDLYPQIRGEIARGDFRGQLFLVAAGMLGKVYGSDLKRRGAVVIDIGSVADAMVGRATRIFPSGVLRSIA